MFDCVMPTPACAHGPVHERRPWVKIRNAVHRDDTGRSDPACAATPAVTTPVAYLRHLDRCNEILGARLNTIHNLHYYLELMRRIRAAIERGEFQRFCGRLPGGPEAAGNGAGQRRRRSGIIRNLFGMALRAQSTGGRMEW